MFSDSPGGPFRVTQDSASVLTRVHVCRTESIPVSPGSSFKGQIGPNARGPVVLPSPCSRTWFLPPPGFPDQSSGGGGAAGRAPLTAPGIFLWPPGDSEQC